MPKKQTRHCHFDAGGTKEVNYKDVETLKRFLSAGMKIRPRRKSGLCALHQRKVANAIKQARIAGLLPFTLSK